MLDAAVRAIQNYFIIDRNYERTLDFFIAKFREIGNLREGGKNTFFFKKSLYRRFI